MQGKESLALLFDYGEVISLPQPAEAIESMAHITGLAVSEFVDRYWRYRPDYDRGGEACAFWSALIPDGSLDAATLEQLVGIDIDSWSVLNADTLDLLAEAGARGWSLSLLSNAPHELATAVSRDPALASFEHMTFSAWIGAMKPEPAAFDAAVHAISRPREQILFIDDRTANVEGAIDAGLRAHHFTSVAGLRAELSL